MPDEIQNLKNNLADVDACIPGCRDKVRRAYAEYFRAKKNSDKELIAFCEQRVTEAKVTLEENLKKRDQLIARLKDEDLRR
jgi:hypothetical protein